MDKNARHIITKINLLCVGICVQIHVVQIQVVHIHDVQLNNETTK